MYVKINHYQNQVARHVEHTKTVMYHALAKVFIHLIFWDVFIYFTAANKYFVLEFNVKDQHKVVYSCEVQRKLYTI